MDRSGSPITITGRFFGMGVAVLMLLGMAACSSNNGVDNSFSDTTPATGSPSPNWSPTPDWAPSPTPSESPSPSDAPVAAETTQGAVVQDDETCAGQAKPIITGKPNPNDNSQVMRGTLEAATPNSITDKSNLAFIAVCVENQTPPWELYITDGTNQSPSLDWSFWGKYAGNTTYDQ